MNPSRIASLLRDPIVESFDRMLAPWRREEERRVQYEAKRTRGRYVDELSRDARRVYFIQSGGGPIKIGISRDVAQRIEAIQSHNPLPCVLLGTMPGGRLMEMALHKRFAVSRIHGEWFHPEPFLARFIGELRDWFVVK